MRSTKFFMAAFLLIGAFLFNHGVDVSVGNRNRNPFPALEYVGCITSGFFLIAISLSFFIWKSGLVDLVDAGIYSFAMVMIPLFEILGVVEIFYWFIFILLPCIVVIFIKNRLKKE